MEMGMEMTMWCLNESLHHWIGFVLSIWLCCGGVFIYLFWEFDWSLPGCTTCCLSPSFPFLEQELGGEIIESGYIVGSFTGLVGLGFIVLFFSTDCTSSC